MTEAEEMARTMVHSGFHDRDEVLAAILETFEEEDLEESAAETLVDRIWQARMAEQETWPPETEADRVLSAFQSLDAGGIVARADFTCCNNCGTTEIGAEVEGTARGYVFFHQQDTESVLAGRGLYLSYGTFGDTESTTIGHEVVAALAAEKLTTDWNGSDATRILVKPLTWQLRLE